MTLNTTVLEMIWMLNELIQANEMVFMNFWYMEVLDMILMLKRTISNISNGY